MKLVKESAEGYKGYGVPYLMIKQEEASDRLAVMLPGAGYTNQAPLFHYATDIYLQKGYDVLNVNYRYNDDFYDDFSMEELSEAVRFDVAKVIGQVLTEFSYKDFCLIGKSLGTIALASELQRPLFRDAAAIWLTPLIKRPDVFDAMLTLPNRALGFIGDEDRVYDAERWNEIKTNPQMTLRLVPGTEHSLEIPGKTLASIDIMKDIMAEIEKF
ncbi:MULTISPECIES: alpha/beta fold hydrolase [Planomicrobium]|uniref:alpha/beta fold hydrolase n=1 Tax=Planomicrobium TaxID=162291 RepID=UPI001E4D7024|nr:MULTISPECIES: alpha/beta hydrolase [Planomicrobium]